MSQNSHVQEIITRKNALQVGLKYYFSGVPCRFGNVEQRLTSKNYCMCQECRTVRSNAQKSRYAANSELRSRIAETQKLKRAENPEYFRAIENNWRKENPVAAALNRAKWAANNKDRNREKASNYRARQLKATPPWFCELDEFVISEAMSLCLLREAATNIKWHMDHMIPLAGEYASGFHCAANIQVIPSKLNHGKRNRMRLTNSGEWISQL